MPEVIINGPEGRIEGRYHHARGGTAPMALVLHPHPLTGGVAGYLFGAWIGMQLLMRRPEIDAFISVSPPANQYDFSFLAPCPSSGLILQGDQDNLVPHESVQKLVHKLSHQRDIKIEYRKIQGADHFFLENTETLTTHVDNYIGAHARIGERAAPATAGRSR